MEQRCKLKCKLEKMEENDNLLEVTISLMLNLRIEIPCVAKAEQPPLEQVKDKKLEYFDEAMI